MLWTRLFFPIVPRTGRSDRDWSHYLPARDDEKVDLFEKGEKNNISMCKFLEAFLPIAKVYKERPRQSNLVERGLGILRLE